MFADAVWNEIEMHRHALFMTHIDALQNISCHQVHYITAFRKHLCSPTSWYTYLPMLYNLETYGAVHLACVFCHI